MFGMRNIMVDYGIAEILYLEMFHDKISAKIVKKIKMQMIVELGCSREIELNMHTDIIF